MDKGLVIIIDPFVGLWRHSQIQTQLANHLSSLGYKVIVLVCDSKSLESCSYFYYRNQEKTNVISQEKCCEECLTRSKARSNLLEKKGIEFLSIKQDFDLAAKLAMHNNGRELLQWEWRDLPVGRFAVYDVALSLKTEPQLAIERDKKRLLYDLENSILILESVIDLANNVKPDAIIVHNGLYSSNRATWEWAKAKNIPIFDVRNVANSKYRNQRYSVSENLSEMFYPNIATYWNTLRELELNDAQCQEVYDYIASNITGSTPFSYSSALSQNKNLPKFDESKQAQKVVLVIFNSLDERRTAQFCGINQGQPYIFVNQLIEMSLEIARKCPEMKFIFRLHPRMQANRRDKFESPDLEEVETLLREKPENVYIDKATSYSKSIYDTAIDSDFIISFGSSAGLFLSALGFEVILGEAKFDWWYPTDIYERVYRNSDIDGIVQYLLTHRRKLNLGRDYNKQQLLALRFIYFNQFVLSTNSGLGSHINADETNEFHVFRRIFRMLSILFDLRVLAAVGNFVLKNILQKSKILKLRVFLNTATITNAKPVRRSPDFWVLLAENHWKDSLIVLCNKITNYQFGVNEETNEERLKEELRQLIKR